MKRTVDVSRETYVCDNCLSTISYSPLPNCCICDREICHDCRRGQPYHPIDQRNLADDQTHFYLCHLCWSIQDFSIGDRFVYETVMEINTKRDKQISHIEELFQEQAAWIKELWKIRALQKLEKDKK